MPTTEEVFARRDELAAQVETQRGASIVDEELRAIEAEFDKKQTALTRAKVSQLVALSKDVRLIRQAKTLQLADEVKALADQRKALRAELPKTWQADKLRKELGLNIQDGKKLVPFRETKKAKVLRGAGKVGMRALEAAFPSLALPPTKKPRSKRIKSTTTPKRR